MSANVLIAGDSSLETTEKVFSMGSELLIIWLSRNKRLSVFVNNADPVQCRWVNVNSQSPAWRMASVRSVCRVKAATTRCAPGLSWSSSVPVPDDIKAQDWSAPLPEPRCQLCCWCSGSSAATQSREAFSKHTYLSQSIKEMLVEEMTSTAFDCKCVCLHF